MMSHTEKAVVLRAQTFVVGGSRGKTTVEVDDRPESKKMGTIPTVQTEESVPSVTCVIGISDCRDA